MELVTLPATGVFFLLTSPNIYCENDNFIIVKYVLCMLYLHTYVHMWTHTILDLSILISATLFPNPLAPCALKIAQIFLSSLSSLLTDQ